MGTKLLRSRIQQVHRRLRGQAAPRWLQSTLRFDVPLRAASPEAMHAELQRLGLTVLEGRHTLYLPPQPGLELALGPAVAAFPSECGFKLLKRFAAPEHAHYLYRTDARGEAALLGSIHDRALAAAALADLGLGPRLYDVVHLRASGVDLTALVVEHVEGRTPQPEEHRALLQALDRARASGRLRLANPSGYECGDFAAPDCNGNLVATEQGLRYVDAQLFLFDLNAVIGDAVECHREVLHFGDRMATVRGGQGFLYQALPGRHDPGRRDPELRWQGLDELLGPHALEQRVVLDVCCNAGLMMAGGLRRGARWAVGWDLPPVAAAARDLLPLLGAGRSTIVGRPLGPDARLADDLPPWLRAEGAVALFLAAWHHVGFPAGVGELPWSTLVYEGREHEDEATTASNVATMEQRWGCTARRRRVITDGLCGPRPLVLLERCR